MKARDFNRIAGELFSQTLRPFGFSNKGSRHCTFFRKVSDEVYHFIGPSTGRSGTWYDVHVFPHSPYIDPQFEERFPDRLGIPTDVWSCLSEHDGVGMTQQQFNCKHEENLRNRFALTVAPLLLNVALPYLDRFRTVADIIPAIRHPSFLALALYHVGRPAEARVALQAERDRLRRLNTEDQDVAALLGHVESLLGTM